jgi:hypothetical protein
LAQIWAVQQPSDPQALPEFLFKISYNLHTLKNFDWRRFRLYLECSLLLIEEMIVHPSAPLMEDSKCHSLQVTHARAKENIIMNASLDQKICWGFGYLYRDDSSHRNLTSALNVEKEIPTEHWMITHYFC